MENNTIEYKQWLVELKTKIRQSQIKAAVRVNTELLRLYWDLGRDIVARQMESAWGSGFFERLSRDLRSEFPDMEGFSERNLLYTKRFYLFYIQDNTIRQQAVGVIPHQVGEELQTVSNNEVIIPQQLVAELEDHPIFHIPWGHHVQIFTYCKSVKEALYYIQETLKYGWSRAVLMNFMKADLYSTQGKAITNFERTMPKPDSDLAQQILKCPYNFGFLTLSKNYTEKDLENALTANITKLLLELGQGFAFVGRQVPVKIGETERFIDMLFYHLELRRYIVIELKVGKFESEYTGKLGVYVAAINDQLKKPEDLPTIGMVVCSSKDNVEVKYSLQTSNVPLGVSEYTLTNVVPEDFKPSLPDIAEIEQELTEKTFSKE